VFFFFFYIDTKYKVKTSFVPCLFNLHVGSNIMMAKIRRLGWVLREMGGEGYLIGRRGMFWSVVLC
jgi:hypothetical protein